ncbi:hypothetical protein [Cystobacter fuscus]|uniref:hypothetical protein n=1 Tax=Cystobacter fuscus TaxID=43 RepID=UPI000BB3A026|nr:hypothetical protein [Cystobacter fuscus]
MKRITGKILVPFSKARVDDHRVVGPQALDDVGESFPEPWFAAFDGIGVMTHGFGEQIADVRIF